MLSSESVETRPRPTGQSSSRRVDADQMRKFRSHSPTRHPGIVRSGSTRYGRRSATAPAARAGTGENGEVDLEQRQPQGKLDVLPVRLVAPRTEESQPATEVMYRISRYQIGSRRSELAVSRAVANRGLGAHGGERPLEA